MKAWLQESTDGRTPIRMDLQLVVLGEMLIAVVQQTLLTFEEKHEYQYKFS
eukprot:gene5821-238_t